MAKLKMKSIKLKIKEYLKKKRYNETKWEMASTALIHSKESLQIQADDEPRTKWTKTWKRCKKRIL